MGLADAALTHSLQSEYFDAILKSGLVSGQGSRCPSTIEPPKFCYTAMHGVGLPFAKRVFSVFAIPPFVSVPQQEDADPSFPTVSFPNPEEKGALDMAKSYAEQQGCDVVLANDPDADRLAVAERSRETGEWTVFTGDQIGALLGSWLWEIIGKTSDKVRYSYFFVFHHFDFVVNLTPVSIPREARCNVCFRCLVQGACRNGPSRRLLF